MPRSGFTLIEVIVAIVIISILVGLAVPALLASKQSAKHSETIQQLRQIGIAVNLYRAEWDGDVNATDADALGLPPDDSAEIRRLMEPYLPRTSGKVVRIWYPKHRRSGDATSFGVWDRYVRACGTSSVLLADFSFNEFDPLLQPKRTTFGIGLRLDGSVGTRTRSGSVIDPFWWDCQLP